MLPRVSSSTAAFWTEKTNLTPSSSRAFLSNVVVFASNSNAQRSLPLYTHAAQLESTNLSCFSRRNFNSGQLTFLLLRCRIETGLLSYQEISPSLLCWKALVSRKLQFWPNSVTFWQADFFNLLEHETWVGGPGFRPSASNLCLVPYLISKSEWVA